MQAEHRPFGITREFPHLYEIRFSLNSLASSRLGDERKQVKRTAFVL